MSILITNQERVEYGHTVIMETIICCECAVPFAMPQELRNRLKSNGNWFYCPNGHRQHYTEAIETTLRKRIDKLNADLQWRTEQRDMAMKSASAMKGQVTKIKNRVANGVCPCCNRTFADLAAHMKTKHPDYKN